MPKHVRLFFVALACSLLPGAATSALASPGQPAPPAGFRPALDPPAGAAVQSELITLPAGECASVNGDTSCQAIHLSYGVNHQALPAARPSLALLQEWHSRPRFRPVTGTGRAGTKFAPSTAAGTSR